MNNSEMIMDNPEVLNPRYVTALVDAALRERLLHGLDKTSTHITSDTFERDGRKVKRATRDLIDAGLIIDKRPQRTGLLLQIERVLATLTAVKPTLAITDDYHRSAVIEGRAPVGIAFDKLTQVEQLWTLTYPHEYRWFWVGNFTKEVDWKPGQSRPDSYSMHLHVSDGPLRDDLGDAQRATKIAALMQQNVGWALEKLVKLDEVTIKTFMSLGYGGFGRSNDEFDGAHPEMWVATMVQYAARAEAKLVAAQAQVTAARAVCDSIMQYAGPACDATDGWVKLAADLLVKVEARIDGNNTDDDEGK